MRIILTHGYPPIPSRAFDWSAHIDGMEESTYYGWGAAEEDALFTDMELIK